jgi:hypothetical protein
MAAFAVVSLMAAPAPTVAAPLDLGSDDPLTVTIDHLAPAVIPKKGRIRISGTITNETDDTWTAINVYPLTSQTAPMTTEAELAAATEANPDLPVGSRITAVSQRIDRLAPGQSTNYSLSIPRSLLGIDGSDGVYWLGVHALGHSPNDEDPDSDGKARTFMPLLDAPRAKQEIALVAQIRRRVPRQADGRLGFPERWYADLEPDGNLDWALNFAAAATDRPLTWIIDPAVLEALNTLANGNEPLLPTEVATTNPDGEQEPPADAANPLPGEWLNTFERLTSGDQLLALPYGDLDASAASRLDPDLLERAKTKSEAAAAALGLTTSRVVSAPNGRLSPEAIADGSGETVIVSDVSAGIDASARAVIGGVPVYVNSTGAVSGGPGPDDRVTTTQMRQRLASEAAVRILGHEREPLVAVLPVGWRGADVDEFFAGLDANWMRFVTLDQITPSARTPILDADAFDYSDAREVPPENFTTAEEMIASGERLQALLVDAAGVGAAVTGQALSALSFWERGQPLTSRSAMLRATEYLDTSAGSVTLNTRPSLTLTSESGVFPVGVTNDLSVPVQVRIGAESDDDLTITGTELLTLQPGETQVSQLTATARSIGVHNLTLYLTTTDGTRLPAEVEFPVRSNQVSQVIWVLMGLGGAVLFWAVLMRVVRRIRRGRGVTE